MKMSKELFDKLADAINKIMEFRSLEEIQEHRQNVKFVKSQFIAFCRSMFHASKFDVTKLYNAGLHDIHIETALKRILSDFE